MSAHPDPLDTGSLALACALFDRCVDLDPAQREALLAEETPDPAVAALLASMLSADRRTQDPFATPAAVWAARLEAGPDTIDGLIGQSIGGFRIVSRLGQGGSSVVFAAERDVAGGTQQVALKLLRTGLFSADAQRRFRREQAILAGLSHPHIARLVDAGVSSAGIPYLAMERIDGRPLVADARARNLDLPARLRLLVAVALAVDVAHRALVVHRDLKPDNILVDREGQVKVLDFGIAKLIDADESTQTQQIALTPGYAAPEQYRPGPLTTAVDVYALGVIGAELVLDARLGPDARVPRGTEAEAQRARWQGLDADLATLLRTALAEDPAQRYASARHFADDIERYLAHEPIAAHPPSARYRAYKFVQRHRSAVAITVLSAAGLVIGLAAALWQAQIAQHESARAQIQAARADGVRQFLENLFEPIERGLPESRQPTVVQLVASGVERLRVQSDLPGTERIDLLLMFARLNDRIGERDVARSLGLEAAQLAEQTLEPQHPTRIEAIVLRGAQAARAGDYESAEVDLNAARAQLRRNNSGGELLISVLDRLAMVHMDRGDHASALEFEHEALDERRRTYGADAREMAAGYNNLGYGLVGARQFAEAAKAYQRAFEIDSRFADPGSEDLLGTLSNWGWALLRAGQIEEARTLLAGADDGLRALGGKPRLMHVLSSQKLCRVDAAYGLGDAETSCARMVETARRFTAGRGLFWGYTLQIEGAHRLERGELERANELADAALREHPDQPEHTRGRGGALQLRAHVLWLRGDASGARRDALDALRYFAGIGDAEIAIIGLRGLLLRSCDVEPAADCPPDLAGMLAEDLRRLQAETDPRLLAPRLWLAARSGDAVAVDAAVASAAQLPSGHPQRSVAGLWRALALASSTDCVAARRAHRVALDAAAAHGNYPWIDDARREWQRSRCAESS
jgi:tetratricopeptide (TPR) repeat protein